MNVNPRNRQVRLTLAALALPLVLAACAHDRTKPDTPVGPERVVRVSLNNDANVELNIPYGEVAIEGTDGNELTAEMVILCRSTDERCAKRLADVELTRSDLDNGVVVGVTKKGPLAYRTSEILTTVRVPKVAALKVDMSAGDLNIDRVPGCVSVDMGAGDVDINAALADVGHVTIDAGIGDASLEIDGKHQHAPRRLLIGAEMDWFEGPGDCDLVVDLQVGDIEVDLF